MGPRPLLSGSSVREIKRGVTTSRGNLRNNQRAFSKASSRGTSTGTSPALLRPSGDGVLPSRDEAVAAMEEKNYEYPQQRCVCDGSRRRIDGHDGVHGDRAEHVGQHKDHMPRRCKTDREVSGEDDALLDSNSDLEGTGDENRYGRRERGHDDGSADKGRHYGRNAGASRYHDKGHDNGRDAATGPATAGRNHGRGTADDRSPLWERFLHRYRRRNERADRRDSRCVRSGLQRDRSDRLGRATRPARTAARSELQPT